jgi:hypothetical protein
MVDPERRVVTVVKPTGTDKSMVEVLAWRPPGSTSPLEIRVADLFE